MAKGACLRKSMRFYEDQPLVAVCVLKGAFIFFQRSCEGPEKSQPGTGFLCACRAAYGMNSESSKHVIFGKDIETDILNKHVLVVEDIVDSGHTMRFFAGSAFRQRSEKPLKLPAWWINTSAGRPISRLIFRIPAFKRFHRWLWTGFCRKISHLALHLRNCSEIIAQSVWSSFWSEGMEIKCPSCSLSRFNLPDSSWPNQGQNCAVRSAAMFFSCQGRLRQKIPRLKNPGPARRIPCRKMAPPKSGKSKFIWLALILCLLGAGGAGAYFYLYQPAEKAR